MTSEVDLRQLAIDRDAPAGGLRSRPHVLTRYVLPLALLAGLLSLVVWASWEYVFPPRDVTVIPVLATRSAVRREGTSLFEAAGWIEPRPTPFHAAALAPGVVERLLVVEDQPVKQGEPVAELVRADAQLALKRAQADLDLRMAELDQAKAVREAAVTRFEQPVHLQAALAQAEASLAVIETELTNLPFAIRRAAARHKFARSDFENKTSVQGVLPGRAIDEARSELDSAAAMVEELQRREASLQLEREGLARRRDAVKKQLELLADEIQARDEAVSQVAVASARVELARVGLAEAELRLERMTIRAPVDGRVYRLVGHPGMTLTGGAPRTENFDGSTVVTLYQPDHLQVRVDVRFEDLPHVSLQQPVRIDNAALDSPLVGHVLFMSSEADIQKNTLEVKVAIDDPPSVLKPEMLMDVTFLAPPREANSAAPSNELRLYLPRQLIQQSSDGSFVWLADQAAGVARRTAVETGDVGADGLTEITAGVDLSHRIIAENFGGLEDGQRIHVTGEYDGPLTSTTDENAEREE
ncbi:MAG: efflux RND transporter periplasmic adaptor subunit [Pirellulaceae bacterium]